MPEAAGTSRPTKGHPLGWERGRMENKPRHHLTSADFKKHCLSLTASSVSAPTQRARLVLPLLSSRPGWSLTLNTACPNSVWTSLPGPASNATAAAKPSCSPKHDVASPQLSQPDFQHSLCRGHVSSGLRVPQNRSCPQLYFSFKKYEKISHKTSRNNKTLTCVPPLWNK